MSDAAVTTAQRLRRRKRRGPIIAGLTTLLLFLAVATQLRADVFTPSVEDQIRLGNQAAAQVMQKYPVVHDNRAGQVEKAGRGLLQALSEKERGRWEFRFHLIDSKEINAFALPGGHLFVFTGLYDRMKTEDELAAVMGHEMTHVRKQHWAHQASEQAKREAGIAVLLGVTHAGRIWQNVAGITDTLLTLRYSRKEEDQADAGGLQNMVDAGYNPRGMLDLFQTLIAASGRGEGMALLRDHPLTKDRIAKAQDRIKALGPREFRPEVSLR